MEISRRGALKLAAGTAIAAMAAERVGAAATNDQLAAALERIRADTSVPALAAAAYRNGQLALGAAVGSRAAGGVPVSLGDRWHIGSVTKPFTATLLARLVDRRRLRWEDRPADLIRCRSPQPAYRAATFETLLAHLGGLQENIDPEAFERFLTDRRDIRAQRRDFACRALAQPPTAAGPGHFAYSNNGYIVAGAAAEARTGQPWEMLMRRLVLEPLRLQSAGFGPPPGGNMGHERDANGSPRPVPPGPQADNPAALGPAGTLHMSVTDLARFGEEHVRLGNGRSAFLTPASVRRLHQGGDADHGLGWVKDSFRGGPLLLHTGSNTLWFALLMVAPASNLSVAVVTNAGRALGGETAVMTAAGRVAGLALA